MPKLKPESSTERAWDALKKSGSDHYKTGLVEPIDLFRAAGMLPHFAICNIVKYAFRQRKAISVADCDKIIHYAQMLKCEAKEGADA